MEVKLTTATGKDSTSKVSINDALLEKEFNEPLIHQVVNAYLAGARSGTKAQKTRSQVRGGGIKPWRQKGTGRARSGTIRSPIWRTGGTTFAAVPRNYEQKVNRKMYRAAICSILSELLRQERLIFVDKFAMDAIKTKDLVEKLNKMSMSDVLIVTNDSSDELYLSARNLHKVEVVDAENINPVNLISHEKVIVTVDAAKKIEEMLS